MLAKTIWPCPGSGKKLNTQSSLGHGKISLFIKQEKFGISRFINVLNSESK